MITRQGSPFGFDAPLSTDEVVERIDTAAGDIATRALVVASQIARIARLTKASSNHARDGEWDICMVLLTAARDQLDAIGLDGEEHGLSHRWLERAIEGVQTAMASSQSRAPAPAADPLGSLMASVGGSAAA
ncbi:MAG: hypothetical protein ACKO2D_04710 [Chloroflexota bacterium]|jgi:hypothetical protein|nr:hypothetical protein [Chloroflexota bacterium]